MKWTYATALGLLGVLALGFAAGVSVTPLGADPRLGSLIQGLSVFAALMAAVVALSAADRKRISVKVRIEARVDQAHVQSYAFTELSDELKQVYQGFPDPFNSHRVHFTMTNSSGFTLEKPTLTFRLPREKRHPEKADGVYSYLTYRSNLFNSQRELRLLEFADQVILSNSNLPYWNDGEDIGIWIRMVLGDHLPGSLTVPVSVNCENADGFTQDVQVPAERVDTVVEETVVGDSASGLPGARRSRGQTAREITYKTVTKLLSQPGKETFTLSEVYHEILNRDPGFIRGTSNATIVADCVNHTSRKHYPGRNQDYYFWVERGVYRLYDPGTDGLWDQQGNRIEATRASGTG